MGYCRFGITTESLDDEGIAHFDLTCPDHHEGGVGAAHGGWTAAALEEILGRVVYLHQQTSVAKSISVEFLRPVPMHQNLAARSWVVGREGSHWRLEGELTLAPSGVVLARATGVSVLVDNKAHGERFQRWLQQQKN